MFQYAAGRHLSLAKRTDLAVDLSQLRRSGGDGNTKRTFDLGCFQTVPREASESDIERVLHPVGRGWLGKGFELIERRRSRERRRLYHHEHPGAYDERFLKAGPDAYLVGYWQSERYFADVASQIREDFTFRGEMDGTGSEWARQIQANDAICLNVRRADFVGSRVHGTCSPEYYMQALALCRQKAGDRRVFVFGDDIDWCRQNLALGSDAEFVTHECAGSGFGQYLRLMTLCSHFVIPNSSFGWWAAWLSAKPGKVVVVPRKWFRDYTVAVRDLIPAGWIRI